MSTPPSLRLKPIMDAGGMGQWSEQWECIPPTPKQWVAGTCMEYVLQESRSFIVEEMADRGLG